MKRTVRVMELKPWVRVVMSAWVLISIPALLGLFAMLLKNAPLAYSTAWESFWVHYAEVLNSFGTGRVVGSIASLIEVLLLILTVAGMTLTFALLGKRLGMATWSWSEGRLARSSLAGRAGRTTRSLGLMDGGGTLYGFGGWYNNR